MVDTHLSFLASIYKRRRTILLSILVGLVGGIGWSVTQPRYYHFEQHLKTRELSGTKPFTGNLFSALEYGNTYAKEFISGLESALSPNEFQSFAKSFVSTQKNAIHSFGYYLSYTMAKEQKDLRVKKKNKFYYLISPSENEEGWTLSFSCTNPDVGFAVVKNSLKALTKTILRYNSDLINNKIKAIKTAVKPSDTKLTLVSYYYNAINSVEKEIAALKSSLSKLTHRVATLVPSKEQLSESRLENIISFNMNSNSSDVSGNLELLYFEFDMVKLARFAETIESAKDFIKADRYQGLWHEFNSIKSRLRILGEKTKDLNRMAKFLSPRNIEKELENHVSKPLPLPQLDVTMLKTYFALEHPYTANSVFMALPMACALLGLLVSLFFIWGNFLYRSGMRLISSESAAYSESATYDEST